MSTQSIIESYGNSERNKNLNIIPDHFLVGELSKVINIGQTNLHHQNGDNLFGDSQGELFIVASGDDSIKDSELASTIAIKTATNQILNFMPWFYNLDQSFEENIKIELEQVLKRCHNNVVKRSTENSENEATCSFTMGYLLWPYLYLVHAGNTACLLARDGSLKKLTKSHTVNPLDPHSQPLEESQGLTEALWNSLGSDLGEVYPEVSRVKLKEGDRILFCTQEILNKLSSCELEKELTIQESAEFICNRIIQKAKAKNDSGILTAIVGKIKKSITEEAFVTHLEEAIEKIQKDIPKEAQLTKPKTSQRPLLAIQ